MLSGFSSVSAIHSQIQQDIIVEVQCCSQWLSRLTPNHHRHCKTHKTPSLNTSQAPQGLRYDQIDGVDMQDFKEPLYLTDKPRRIEDTRTEEQRKYPQLFRHAQQDKH